MASNESIVGGGLSLTRVVAASITVSPNQTSGTQAAEAQPAVALPAEQVTEFKPDNKSVNTELASLNQSAQVIRRNLQFVVDDSIGKTIITVKDSTTDEVIRQIPPETMIAIARFFREQESSVTPVVEQQPGVRGLLFNGQS